MTSSRKLFTGFIALAVTACALGITGLTSTARLGRELDEWSQVTTPKVISFKNIQSDVSSARLALLSCAYSAGANRPAEVAAGKQQFLNVIERAQANAKAIRPLLITEKSKQVIAVLSGNLTDFDRAGRQEIDFLEAGKFEDAIRIHTNAVTPLGDQITSGIEQFLGVQEDYLRQASIRSVASQSAAKWEGGILLVLVCAIAAVCCRAVVRMDKTLRSMARAVDEGAKQIASASQQVAGTSERVASGACEQAASIEEVSAAAVEMTATTRQNEKGARHAAQLMDDAQKIGGDVHESMTRLEESMNAINDSSNEISKILRTIDEIAFQTNILALNAAVEAARAGESGLGFAVVADEVRSLAQRCGQAAADTSLLVERAVASSREGKTRLDAVKSTWNKSGEIRDSVKSLSDEIAEASREQSRTIEEISKSITQISQVIQSAAAHAEESAAASRQLSGVAEALTSVPDRLRALVG